MVIPNEQAMAVYMVGIMQGAKNSRVEIFDYFTARKVACNDWSALEACMIQLCQE